MPSEITYKDIVLYKTEHCRNWEEKGFCRYGKRCRYAHGTEELRPILRSNQYKTKICRAYHENGTCSYGIRCTFIHQVDENKSQSSNDDTSIASQQQPTEQSSIHYSDYNTTSRRKQTHDTTQDSVLCGGDKVAACSYISSNVWDSMMGLSSYDPSEQQIYHTNKRPLF